VCGSCFLFEVCSKFLYVVDYEKISGFIHYSHVNHACMHGFWKMMAFLVQESLRLNFYKMIMMKMIQAFSIFLTIFQCRKICQAHQRWKIKARLIRSSAAAATRKMQWASAKNCRTFCCLLFSTPNWLHYSRNIQLKIEFSQQSLKSPFSHFLTKGIISVRDLLCWHFSILNASFLQAIG